MNSIIDYIRHPRILANTVLNHVASFISSDEMFIRMKWWINMNYPLHLDNPLTFSEKLQWLKLHDHRPEYTQMVDKVEAKKYVAKIIGDQYIIPTLGVWDNPDDIDFDSLPDQFVLKCNHNSGTGMYICKEKETMNKERVKSGLTKGLEENYFIKGREWPYKNVKRRIIAEQFLTDGSEELTDYKFYCFGGEPKYCQVIKDRHSKETIDFFDMDWKHQDFVGLNPVFGPMFGHAAVRPERPEKYEEMLSIARQLSQGIPFVRIDLYEVNGKVFWGEITLYPASGIGGFAPRTWDKKLGSMILLS